MKRPTKDQDRNPMLVIHLTIATGPLTVAAFMALLA